MFQQRLTYNGAYVQRVQHVQPVFTLTMALLILPVDFLRSNTIRTKSTLSYNRALTIKMIITGFISSFPLQLMSLVVY
jgi:hypothetical protein